MFFSVSANDEKIITVHCQGCESECEVSVSIKEGKLTCLGGNNCPTGEQFALSQASFEITS